MQQLRGCWQGNQRLSDVALEHCARLPSLQHLETSNCWHFTDAGLVKLTALTALAHLDLSYCWQVKCSYWTEYHENLAYLALDSRLACDKQPIARLGPHPCQVRTPIIVLVCVRLEWSPTGAVNNSFHGEHRLRVCMLSALHGLQVTDRGVENLVKSMTSLVTLNIMGCHRLTPRAKGQVARLLDNPFND